MWPHQASQRAEYSKTATTTSMLSNWLTSLTTPHCSRAHYGRNELNSRLARNEMCCMSRYSRYQLWKFRDSAVGTNTNLVHIHVTTTCSLPSTFAHACICLHNACGGRQKQFWPSPVIKVADLSRVVRSPKSLFSKAFVNRIHKP